MWLCAKANLKFDIVIKLKVKQCQELWLNNMFTSGLKVTVDWGLHICRKLSVYLTIVRKCFTHLCGCTLKKKKKIRGKVSSTICFVFLGSRYIVWQVFKMFLGSSTPKSCLFQGHIIMLIPVTMCIVFGCCVLWAGLNSDSLPIPPIVVFRPHREDGEKSLPLQPAL